MCAPSDEGVGVGEERHEEALEDGEEGDVGEVEDARGGEECAEVEAGECGEERALRAGVKGGMDDFKKSGSIVLPSIHRYSFYFFHKVLEI